MNRKAYFNFVADFTFDITEEMEKQIKKEQAEAVRDNPKMDEQEKAKTDRNIEMDILFTELDQRLTKLDIDVVDVPDFDFYEE